VGRLWAMIIKEFIEIRRDPRTLALVMLMPILLLILFGFAITLDITHIPTAVCDRDRTPESRALAEAIFSSRYFTNAEPEACGRTADLLDRGRVRLYLEIPPDFSDRLASGAAAPIQAILDGADNNTASVSEGYLETILKNFRPDSSRGRPAPGGDRGVSIEPRIWFNPELNSTIFITPGIVGMLMMIVGVALPAMAVVRERETGNMEVLLSSPIRPVEVILGKLIPYGLISLMVVALTVVTGLIVFHVPFRGSVAHLAWQTLVFLLATLGLGLLISTVAKTRAVAYFISLIATVLPTFILSGFIFPIDSMPWALRIVSFLIPSTHYLFILRGILLKGASVGALWFHTAILLGFALIVITISVRRFQTRLT
jgi:ABC-2 type transport system permease protein